MSGIHNEINKIKSVWTACSDGKFATEDSTLSANWLEPICPGCYKKFSKKHLVNILRCGTVDNEITGWKYLHNCGSILMVFND